MWTNVLYLFIVLIVFFVTVQSLFTNLYFARNQDFRMFRLRLNNLKSLKNVQPTASPGMSVRWSGQVT